MGPTCIGTNPTCPTHPLSLIHILSIFRQVSACVCLATLCTECQHTAAASIVCAYILIVCGLLLPQARSSTTEKRSVDAFQDPIDIIVNCRVSASGEAQG